MDSQGDDPEGGDNSFQCNSASAEVGGNDSPDLLDQSVGLPDSGPTVEPQSTPGSLTHSASLSSGPSQSQGSQGLGERAASEAMPSLFLEETQTQRMVEEEEDTPADVASGQEMEVANKASSQANEEKGEGGAKRAAAPSDGESAAVPVKRPRQDEEEEGPGMHAKEEPRAESPGSFFDDSGSEPEILGVKRGERTDAVDQSVESVTIDSPQVPDSKDDSVVIVEADQGNSPAGREILPKLRVPDRSQADTSLPLAAADCSASSTLDLFTKLAPQASTTNQSEKDGEHSKALPAEATTSSPAVCSSSADDELSREVSVTTPSADGCVPKPVAVVSAPSVSPISGGPPEPVASAKQREATATTSTPGRVSPRKRVLTSQMAARKAAVGASPSSEEENQGSDKARPKRTRKKSPAEKTDGDDSFKKPLSDVVNYILLVDDNASKLQLAKFKNELQKLLSKYRSIKLGSSGLMPKEAYETLHSQIADSTQELSSPEMARGESLKLKRLSEGSSTSTLSKSTSGGSGYMGDGSSGSSCVSSRAGRDRLSILPEATVSKHDVLSPLPKKMPAKPLEDSLPQQDSSKPTTSSFAEKPAKSPISENKGAAIIGHAKDEPKDRSKVPVRSSRAKKPKSSTRATEALDSTLPTLRAEINVFAKFVESRSSIRYWPAFIKDEEEDGRWKVRFIEDEIEKICDSEDLVPAESLRPGQPVNVLKEDLYHEAKLVAFPDLSESGTVSYQLEFEPVEGIPQTPEQLVPFTSVILTAEQFKSAVSDLGGRWTTPKVSKAELDLSNILDDSSRSRRRERTSTASTPSRSSVPSGPKSARASASRGTPSSQVKKRGGEDVETSAPETDLEQPERSRKGTPRKKLAASSTEDEVKVSSSATKPRGRLAKAALSKKSTLANLFSGLSFLITKGTKCRDDDKMWTETEEEDEEEDDDETIRETSGPNFSKTGLRQLVIRHGGQVLESFPCGEDGPVPPTSSIVVLSDQHCQTMTYLLAIAYKFQRVSFVWVHDCIKAGKRQPLSNYELAVGELDGSLVESRDVKKKTAGKSLLGNKGILVVGESKGFVGDWAPMITRLGGSVIKVTKRRSKIDESLGRIDVILAESASCQPNLLADARAKRIPVVRAKWVIHSVIKGQQLPIKNFAL